MTTIFQARTGAEAGPTAGPAGVNKQGHLVIMDWLQWMMLAGKIFQVRAGTVTTPIIGGVPLADTAAEFCVDALAGYTVIPIFQNISVRLGTGTLHEYATKSVKAVSSAGTAFVPLPMRNKASGGQTAVAAVTTARVQAAGAVTVTAEAVTTTMRHWSFSNPVAAAAGHEPVDHNWEPRRPPFLGGPVCLYTQVNATGTGPSFYASLDYAEALTSMLF